MRGNGEWRVIVLVVTLITAVVLWGVYEITGPDGWADEFGETYP